MPRSARSVASLAGVSPSHDSARMRAPGCRWRTMPSSARPCRLTSATSCSAQPSRAAARLKADGCGRQTISSGGNGAQQQVADAVVERIAARQHDDRPAAMLLDLRQRVADRARPGERCGRGSARRPGRDGACRRPPARPIATSCRATGDRPSTPSSPMPTMDSQRAAGQLRLSVHARSHPRRHDGSLGAGRACSRAIRASTATLSLAGRTAQPAAAAASRRASAASAAPTDWPTSCASRRSRR